MNTTKTGIPESQLKKLPIIAVVMLAMIYIANCFTPLRLTNDTVRYINIAEWLQAGKPANDPAGNDFLPLGYVWFLILLSKLSLAKPFFISIIHLLYLFCSFYFIKKIFGPAIKLWHLLCLCLLNWATMKFVITPLSEMQFLFFSTGALYFYLECERKGKISYLAGMLLFCVAAMLTRTAGAILIVAFLASFLITNRQKIFKLLRTNKFLIPGLIFMLIVGALLFNQFRIVKYIHDHAYHFEPFRKNPFSFIGNNIRNHLIDLSALSLNSPSPNVTFLGTPFFRQTVYLVAGILTLGWILYSLFRRGNTIPVLIKVYLVGYIILILCWPFFEPRFWVPALPLFIAVILHEKKVTSRLLKYSLSTYKVVYILIGLTALSYYTYTSFDKKAFSIKQDAGIWKNEYQTHFFGKPLTDTAAVVREPILRILKKYD